MPKAGTNLSFIQWFRETHYFTDLMLQARRPWVHLPNQDPADNLAPVSYAPGWRSDGYPNYVFDETHSSSRHVTYVVAANQAPYGIYKVYFDGSGEVRATIRQTGITGSRAFSTSAATEGVGNTDSVFSATAYTNDPGGILGDLDTPDRIEVTIRDSNAQDPVRNIRVIVPGHDVLVVRDKNHPNYNPFNPDFLAELEKFDTLRFMDWTRTNESIDETWAGRTQPDFYSWGTEFLASRLWSTPGASGGAYSRKFPGVPWEAVILLAKLTGKNVWINVPWLADNDYIDQMAALFKDNVPTGQTIYLEFGNEPWNTSFTHGAAYRDSHVFMLQDRGLPAAGSNYIGRQMLEAWDSINCFKRWKTAFGADFSSRVKTVVSSQSTEPAWTEDLLGSNGFSHVDVNPDPQVWPNYVAVAPYVGSQWIKQWSDLRRNDPNDPNNPGAGEDAATARAWLAANRDRDYMLGEANDRVDEFVKDNVSLHKTNASGYPGGIKVIAYEGGQHYVLNPPYLQEESDFRDEVFKVYRHPDMYQIYRNIFSSWESANADELFCVYNECQDYENSGGWGTKEHRYQVDAAAHRDRAVTDWITEQVNSLDAVPSGAADTVYDLDDTNFVDLSTRTDVSPYSDDEDTETGGGDTGGGDSPDRDKVFIGITD